MQVIMEGEIGSKPLREALKSASKRMAAVVAIVAAVSVGPLPAFSLTVPEEIMFLRDMPGGIGSLGTTASETDVAKASEEEAREILWLARAVYSESKRASEQRLVAWVIRNRVESLRYPDTYERVVLQRGQFSGLHPTDRQYALNISRDYTHGGEGWESALSIAREVYYGAPSERVIGATVTHFFSPVSVRATPLWARDKAPAHTVVDATGTRFAFYADVK